MYRLLFLGVLPVLGSPFPSTMLYGYRGLRRLGYSRILVGNRTSISVWGRAFLPLCPSRTLGRLLRSTSGNSAGTMGTCSALGPDSTLVLPPLLVAGRIRALSLTFLCVPEFVHPVLCLVQDRVRTARYSSGARGDRGDLGR